MKNIGHIRFIELLLLFFISTPIICLTDVEQLFKPFNNTSRGRTEVNSDEIVLNSSRNFSTSIRQNGISVRCKRYAQTYYKPYQRVGTYVYDPYGPYIVPPICIRCPTCCPRPCSYPYPSPAPIRTTYRPYRTHGTTSVPRITSSFGTTNKGRIIIILNLKSVRMCVFLGFYIEKQDKSTLLYLKFSSKSHCLYNFFLKNMCK